MLKKLLPTILIIMLAASTGCANGSISKPVSAVSPVSPISSTPAQSPAAEETKNGWTVFTNGNRVWSLLADENSICAATSGGLYRWDTISLTYRKYTTLDGLASNDIRVITKDKEGNLWFGTNEGGISRFDGTNFTTWTHFTDPIYPNADSVYYLVEDQKGRLWYAADGVYVGYFDGTNWQNQLNTLRTALKGNFNTISSMVEDAAGILWVGAGLGLYRYDGVNWQTLTSQDGMAGDNVMPMLSDDKGNLWLGTDGGISRYDGVSWQNYLPDV